ncbi:MAG TPA: hypothetical protein VNO33_09380, partial [Kofleriaceae bacterium]|nr:hypothetical protein [Kofleriaceae bacterium]
MVYGLALVFTVIVGLVLVAARQADERDRSPYLWGGLTAAASVGAAMVSWRWLAGGVEALDSDGSMVAAGFALIVGPIAAPTLVIAGLRRLPPGRPRILAPV